MGVHNAMTARIKLLGRMDVVEKRRPQDGRIKTDFSLLGGVGLLALLGGGPLKMLHQLGGFDRQCHRQIFRGVERLPVARLGKGAHGGL